MDRRLLPPTFSNAPAEYNQRYMEDVIRSLNDLVTVLRSPGLGRNTTTTFTNLSDAQAGLESGTVWDENGVARVAGTGPDALLGTHVYGQISRTTSGTVTITTAGTYVSTGLLATLDAGTAEGIALGTSDTFAVKNISGKTRLVPIFGSIDANTVSGGNKILGIKLALNGVVIDQTECRANQPSAGLEAKLVTRWIVRMDPDDEVALFIANISDTTNITFKRGRIVVA